MISNLADATETGQVSHDALFIALISLLGAMVASPVLMAFVQNYLLKKHTSLHDIWIELRHIRRVIDKRETEKEEDG